MIARVIKAAATTGFGLLMAAAPMVAPAAQAEIVTPGPESAYSYEWNTGVLTSGPSGTYHCISTTGSTACYKPYGDKIYVKDTKADGYSAVMRWYTNYGRWGTCRNPYKAGTWVVCDKDFAEGSWLNFRASRYDGETKKWIGPESDLMASTT
ncbi:hypothetical protein ABZV93_24525 [Actinopolymorpha sp. NPDC004070]|uniref:hypothetical protein n=1 Tax=Actinopolymorpha sp. NPDC004070 TaxID=3154548 RepID=UPI0033A8A2F1